MADMADIANTFIEKDVESIQKEICNQASRIPKGYPGECDLCGEWSGRLVEGACAPCRDKYKLG